MSNDQSIMSFNPEVMMQEYTLLKNDLVKYDTLYDQVFKEIQAVKGRSKIPYVFISAQYTTLASILNNRQTVISKLFDMKKIVEDFKLKYQKLDGEQQGENSDNKEIIKDLLKMLNGKTIPYQDLDKMISPESLAEEDLHASSVEGIGDQLDNMFDTDEEGLIIQKASEVIEEPKEESNDVIELDVEEELVTSSNLTMQELNIKVLFGISDEAYITVIHEVNYSGEILDVEYDLGELAREHPELYDFLNYEDYFGISEDDQVMIPKGFTEYKVEIGG